MNKKIKIKDYCEFPKAEEKEPSYIGLKIEKNKKNNERFHFIFPVSYYTEEEYEKITENTLRNDIKNLLKAIYKANISEVYYNKKSQEETSPIDAYLWIIRNYLEEGYYIEKEIIYNKKNQGKINWKRTIKNNEYLIYNNNIIYTKFITKQSINNISGILTLIHKYCVYEAIGTFSFLFDINLKNVEIPQANIRVEEMISILKNEYTKSFLDSKKELLINMIKMLEWLADENTSYDMFSTYDSKFQVVFENLINERFGNVKNIEEYYPFGYWHIIGKEQDYKSSYLREDTILKEKDNIYILDAKYYKYGYNITKELPNTSSIAKQFIYGKYVYNKYIKKANSQGDIYNIFLIPFNGQGNYIEYIGYSYGNWSEDEDKIKTYNKIYTFKIDLKILVNDSFGTKQKNIDELIKAIEKVH